VTGAGGYVGIPLCRALLEKGYDIIALDRYFFGREKMKGIEQYEGATILKDDLRDFDTSILQDVDAVIDLAGLSNDASGEIDPELTKDITYRGSARVAHAAKEHGVTRYIYSSSASVYGAGSKSSLTEEDELAPLTEYAKSKVAMEGELLNLNDENFEVVLLRNATIYGLAERMRFDLAINIMTMRAWRDRVIYIMGGGEQWRPFVHIQDVVKAFVAAMEAPSELVNGQIFNVGSYEQNYQIKQLAKFVLDIIPNVEVHNVPDSVDKRTYNVSFQKINDTIGFRATTKVHEGIVEIKQALERGEIVPDDPTSQTVHWYKSLLDWSQRIEEIKHKGKIL
jgi:nucleoside-diphosphate-sugar epimerase